MATDYTVRLSAQDNLTPALKGVKQAFNEATASTADLDKIAEKFHKIENSSAPLKKKLKDIQMLMAQINLNGDPNSPIYTKMAQAAGTYKDAIADAADATKRFASDTMNLEAAAGAVSLVAASASAATGVMGMLGVENENVAQAILKVQSAMAILNGVQQIANLLNKDSVLMMKVKQIRQQISTNLTKKDTVATKANNVAQITSNTQTKAGSVALAANSAAQVTNTAVTSSGTVAQNAWNIAKAVAKALVGDFTGLLLVGAAGLATYAMATSDSTDEIEKQERALTKEQKALKQQKEAWDTYKDALKSSISDMVGSFTVLQAQWRSLETLDQKNQFLEHYKSQLKEVADGITDVVAAEKLFNMSTNDFIKSTMERAKASAVAAVMKKLQDDLAEEISQIISFDTFHGMRSPALPNGTVPDWVKDTPGIKEGEHYKKIPVDQSGDYYYYEPLKEGTEFINQYRADKQIEEASTRYEQRVGKLSKSTNVLITDALESMFEDIGVDTKEIKTNTDSRSKKNEYPTKKDSETYWNNLANKELEILRKNPVNSQEWKTAVENYIKYKTEAEKAKEINDNATKLEKDQLDLLQQKNEELKNQEKILKMMRTNNPDDLEGIKKQEEVVKNLRNEIKQIEYDWSDIVKGSLPDLERQYQDLLKLRLTFTAETDAETVNEINNQIDELEKKINDLKIKLHIESDDPKTTLDRYYEQLDKFGALQVELDYGLIDVTEAKRRLNDINEEIKKIGGNPLQLEIEVKFNQWVDGLVDNSIISQVLELGKALKDGVGNSAQYAGASIAILGQQLAQFSSEGTLAKVAAVTAAVGQIILGFASASVQAAQLGPLGWLAWTAAGLATVAATIATIQKFADGGIVGGNSFVGDRQLVRVNAGEMILNNRQQRNLFNLLDSGNPGKSGKTVSEIRVKGSDLYIALKNYNSKMSKLR